MSTIISAIDIGTTKIVALIARKNDRGRMEVIGMGTHPSYGVARGEVINIEKTATAIQRAVEIAEQMANHKITSVHVGIAGRHIRCMQNRGYLMREFHDVEITTEEVKRLRKDQENILLNPGEQIIHVLPQNYIIDKEHETINPEGSVGKRLEANFHLVIGKVDSINYLRKSVEKAGLQIRSIVLEPLASGDAVLVNDEKEVGVAMVDIGGGTTDVAVYHEGKIKHTAVIPFGGNIITQDIKSGFGIMEKHAEELKRQFGQAIESFADKTQVISIPGIKDRPAREIKMCELAGSIQARMEEIIDGILFEIESSGVMKKLGAGIVLTGGGAMTKNLNQLVAFKTGLDARIGYPNEFIECGRNVTDINHPMYSTAVGLLLRGFDLESETDMDKQDTTTAQPLKQTSVETEKNNVVTEEAPKQAEPVVATEINTPKQVVEVKQKVNKDRKETVKPKNNSSFLFGIKDNLTKLFDVDDDNDTKITKK